jgi:hypothetical protein
VNYYRLYYVKGGHFAGFDGFSAEDDVDAVRQAEILAEGRHAELWCGKRKVRTFNASADAAAAPIPPHV